MDVSQILTTKLLSLISSSSHSSILDTTSFIDPTIVSYVTQILIDMNKDDEDEGMSIDDLIEVLCGLIEGLDELKLDEQVCFANFLISGFKPDDSGNNQIEEEVDSSDSSKNNDSLAFLKALIPSSASTSFPDNFLEYIHVIKCSSQLEQSSMLLLSLIDEASYTDKDLRVTFNKVKDDFSKYEYRQSSRQRSTSKENQRNEDDLSMSGLILNDGQAKKAIIARFADELEPNYSHSPSQSSTLRKGQKAKQGKKEKIDPESKIRFRDGNIVSRTGQKVIIEDLKPEWDGGSVGKVKSKGKRGKGIQ